MTRIKILLIGDNPESTVADALLIRERGLLVFTVFNPQNISDTIEEIKPDLVFFDPHSSNALITEAYNNFVNDIANTQVPVIYTLSDDDVYLVTRKRTASKGRRTGITDNIISAIKMALSGGSHAPKKTYRLPHSNIVLPIIANRA